MKDRLRSRLRLTFEPNRFATEQLIKVYARRSVNQITQELTGDHPGRFGPQSYEGELGCAIDPNEQLKFAFLGPHFRPKSFLGSMWT